MGIFNKRQSVSRRELREIFRKHSGRIPGTGGRKYYQSQRQRMEKEAFGSKYGSEISKGDWRRAIQEQKSAMRRAKTRAERKKIDEKIRYLTSKELGGKI